MALTSTSASVPPGQITAPSAHFTFVFALAAVSSASAVPDTLAWNELDHAICRFEGCAGSRRSGGRCRQGR